MGIVIKTIKKSLNKGYLKHNIHKPKFEEFKKWYFYSFKEIR